MSDGKWWYRTYVLVAEIKILHPTFFINKGPTVLMKFFCCLVKTSRVLDSIFLILLNLVIQRTGERGLEGSGKQGQKEYMITLKKEVIFPNWANKTEYNK